jgi:hypothetical protein
MKPTVDFLKMSNKFDKFLDLFVRGKKQQHWWLYADGAEPVILNFCSWTITFQSSDRHVTDLFLCSLNSC